MLKKILASTLFLSFSFSSHASNSTLIISPKAPSSWGYMNASVCINNTVTEIRSGTTLAPSPNAPILLQVYAMNSRPKLSASCLNLTTKPGSYKLQFELQPDWQIHCDYYAVDAL